MLKSCVILESILVLWIFQFFNVVRSQSNINFNDICGVNNGKRFYLEFGESGSVLAKYENFLLSRNKYDGNLNKNFTAEQRTKRCSIEFVTCPSCVFQIKFRFLNISRTCGKASVFDSCGCDYVLIYEPPFEDVSGEQFCGRFIQNNITEIKYNSQTRTVAINFVFSSDFGHAFTLDYSAERNRIHLDGNPKIGNLNNASQVISSPFFPNLYPPDLSVEYLINCWSKEPCQISLVFTDYLLAESSILEFFDWNGQRMYVTSGNIFRPPVIVTSGPSMVIRFYANGASAFGFKGTYSFILGTLDDLVFKPNIGCGGHVNNLGGGITMMNMITEGTKFFDCIWIIKPPGNYFHRKTHLYVKVITFEDFAGTTELIIRQGLTSNEPSVEVFRYPFSHFSSLFKKQEHVVPIAQGFYISLKGLFRKESRLAIVYAAFNYKDCYSGSEFLCHNLRCIPVILNCDGFDHCGDSSDESPSCSQDPQDHRQFSKIPNFLFPRMDSYSDLTAASLVFLMCTFGLIGVIFAVALLLYRVNLRARHQRQIQNHLETIHAILEEGVGGVEEEVIIPDEPPDYEPPPDYSDVWKLQKYIESVAYQKQSKRCQCNLTTRRNASIRPSQSPHFPPTNSRQDGNSAGSSTTTDHSTNTENFPVEHSSTCQTERSTLIDNLPTECSTHAERSTSVQHSIITECSTRVESSTLSEQANNIECSTHVERATTPLRYSTHVECSILVEHANETGCSMCATGVELSISDPSQTDLVKNQVRIPESPPPAYERIERKWNLPEENEIDSLGYEHRETDAGVKDFGLVNGESSNSAANLDTTPSTPRPEYEHVITYNSMENPPITCFPKINPTSVFKEFSESFQKSIKNCKSKSFMNTFLSRSEENVANTFSESELLFNTCSSSGKVGEGSNFWSKIDKRSRFKKSYSTDDIYAL